jgi:hypothetical protein
MNFDAIKSRARGRVMDHEDDARHPRALWREAEIDIAFLLAETERIVADLAEAKRLRSEAISAHRSREDAIEKAEKRASTAEMERDEARAVIAECSDLVAGWYESGGSLADAIRNALADANEQRDEAIARAKSRPAITREDAVHFLNLQADDTGNYAARKRVEAALRLHAAKGGK